MPPSVDPEVAWTVFPTKLGAEFNPENTLLVTNCNAVLSDWDVAVFKTNVYSPELPVAVALCIVKVVPAPPNWNVSPWLGAFVKPSATNVVVDDIAPFTNGVPWGW